MIPFSPPESEKMHHFVVSVRIFHFWVVEWNYNVLERCWVFDQLKFSSQLSLNNSIFISTQYYATIFNKKNNFSIEKQTNMIIINEQIVQYCKICGRKSHKIHTLKNLPILCTHPRLQFVRPWTSVVQRYKQTTKPKKNNFVKRRRLCFSIAGWIT